MSERAPLAGVRVLSFGTFVAGNAVGHLLAELGAEVVKVESRSRPEATRQPPYTYGVLVEEPSGTPNTLMHASMSRGARGIALEMSTAGGQAVFRRLAGAADVVVENFGATVLDNWGCGFDALRAHNAGIIVLSISGYGRTGPRASFRSYAADISSFVGLHAVMGQPHITHHDYVAAIHGAVAVVAGLREVARTGTGVHLDISQLETGGTLMAPSYLGALNGGSIPDPDDDRPVWTLDAVSLLAGIYRCRSRDEWVALELEDARDWTLLCEVLDRADLAVDGPDAPELDDKRARLVAALGTWLEGLSPHRAAQILQRAGIAAAVVQNGEDLTRDPQLRARGAIVSLHQPDIGPFEAVGPPYRFSRTPPPPRGRGPRLGEHTREILTTWVGMDDDEIDRLQADGSVFAL